MSSKRQMKRGKNQALYKYLPETWIDFSLRGDERKQYIAKVERWNSEKLDGINAQRLIRTVDKEVRAFAKLCTTPAPSVPPIIGFGTELTKDNCDVLTPLVSDEERGIVARISPLTFYCKKCYKVHQFNDEDAYRKNHKCKACGVELAQFRQIYFCKCGYATDKHNARCTTHGSQYIKWDRKYNFICTYPGCNKKIPMQVKCPICGEILKPKVALDPAQFFVFSHSLIDLIDEEMEDFISKTDYGAIVTFAYWLNMISKQDFDEIVKSGIVSDPETYQKIYEEEYQKYFALLKNEGQASLVAKQITDEQCGNKFNEIINDLRGKLCATPDNLSDLAEKILEHNLVKGLEDVSDLSSAIEVAKLLNTNANPERYAEIAHKFGIANAQVCDRIPFISCSYGYTRAETTYSEGVQLHALKERKNGRKNVYATKLNTEGVLFEFDRKKILEWLLANDIIAPENAPDLNSEEDIKLWFINNIKPEAIQRFAEIKEEDSKETYYVYRLIHSISHLLIRAAADIGGLGKDSLSEYIFPGIPSVLIYCQNSQGFNLGSLYNTFEAYFDKWLYKAFNSAQKCIFDPICIERHKACTGCLFVNEVSCQHYNKDLDRSFVIGHIDRETQKKFIGFWEE